MSALFEVLYKDLTKAPIARQLLVRLATHFSQLETFFASGESVGRKSDFLIQEAGREINTVGNVAPGAFDFQQAKNRGVQIIRLNADFAACPRFGDTGPDHHGWHAHAALVNAALSAAQRVLLVMAVMYFSPERTRRIAVFISSSELPLVR